MVKKNEDFAKLGFPFERDEAIAKVQKQKLIALKGQDSEGRPVVYGKLRNFFPGGKVSDREYQTFMYYTAEQIY